MHVSGACLDNRRYIFTGLVVAIMDHEHFRLKVLYKQKKKVSAELKTVKSDIKGLEVSLLQNLLLEVMVVCVTSKDVNKAMERHESC